MIELAVGSVPCRCRFEHRAPRFLVLTGGPGAGKTAALEMVRRSLCRHLAILPEAASIVFGGGFPRGAEPFARRAAQRAIYRVQVELEHVAREAGEVAVSLCDRGTLDGLAYWPGAEEDWLSELGTNRDAELSRYAAVIHLRTPPESAYDRKNTLRIETANEALAIDARIEEAWRGHPRRFFVESSVDFLAKVARVVELIRAELPACCRAHVGLGDDTDVGCP